MELNDLGIRIPEELSVIGFDNIDFAKATVPRLSIVTQPTAKIAQEAAEIMIDRLAGKDRIAETECGDADEERTTVTVTLKTGFVEGRSVRILKNEA